MTTSSLETRLRDFAFVYATTHKSSATKFYSRDQPYQLDVLGEFVQPLVVETSSPANAHRLTDSLL